MNDAKHTKGPWHFAYDGPSLPIVCTENEIIALVRTGRTNENTEIEANARLIAAAPELLEALCEFMDDAYMDNGTLCCWCGYRTEVGSGHLHNRVCRVGKAEAAIAKAEGRS